MGCEFVHIFGDVDDFDGLEGAFLDADTASNTKDFRDVYYGRVRHNLNTYLLRLIDGTALLTLLFAALWLAFFHVNNCDTMFIFHIVEI
jgi:hypothetical protein